MDVICGYQRMGGMFLNRVLNENMGINQDYLTLFQKLEMLIKFDRILVMLSHFPCRNMSQLVIFWAGVSYPLSNNLRG